MNNSIAEGVIRFTVVVRVLCDICHDNGDRRTNEIWSTGRNLTYGYDRAHQLTDVTSPTRASDRASYRYDKAGNPIRRTEMGFGVTNSFNNLNQIVAGVWTGGAITVAGAVNYPAGTVTVNSITGRIFPDRVFEVTNVTVTAGTNSLTAVYHGPAFTNTQMVATDKVTVVVGNAAYTHDANGSLTGDQNFTYQYDLANRLTDVILKASNISVLAISYDGLGRRIEVVRNGSTVERYVYFPGSFLVLAILDGSNNIKEFYTHGPDLSGTLGGAGGIGGILSVTTNISQSTARKYLHADAMGNVVLVSDSEGTQVASYGFTPFGKLVNQVGNYRARFLFSSKELDPETELINFGYRFLNTRQGTWLTRDPIEESQGLNLYLFCVNNSLRHIDPDGREYIDLVAAESAEFVDLILKAGAMSLDAQQNAEQAISKSLSLARNSILDLSATGGGSQFPRGLAQKMGTLTKPGDRIRIPRFAVAQSALDIFNYLQWVKRGAMDSFLAFQDALKTFEGDKHNPTHGFASCLSVCIAASSFIRDVPQPGGLIEFYADFFLKKCAGHCCKYQ